MRRAPARAGAASYLQPPNRWKFVRDGPDIAFVSDDDALLTLREFAEVQRFLGLCQPCEFGFEVDNLVVNRQPLPLEEQLCFGLVTVIRTLRVPAVTGHDDHETIVF